MREYTEPTPSNLQEFSAGRILKESWEICTKYFGALVMPAFILMIPAFAIAFLVPGKGGEALNNVYSAIFYPIAIMGLHHSVLRLKAEGMMPSFGRTFSFGSDYWWRGIKIGIVSGLYSLVLVLGALLASAIFFVPGILLVDKNKEAGVILFILAGIVFLCIAAWFACRACLAYAAMADHQESATRAFEYGMSLTKGNERKTLKMGLAISGVALAVILGFVIVGAICEGSGVLEQPMTIGILGLAAVFAYVFLLCLAHVATHLAYQSLKPAPKEENQLPPA